MTNTLTNVEKEEQLVVSSIEVAEMTEKRHDHLMRDIRGYIGVLEDSPILGSRDFFVEGIYIDGSNRIKPCYFLTRKGCDMVANKMTGEKGILFTATYVDRFYEMENQLKEQQPKLPTTYKEALLALVEAEEVKEQLALENRQQKEIIEEQKPMVTFVEKITATNEAIKMREVAKLTCDEGKALCKIAT